MSTLIASSPSCVEIRITSEHARAIAQLQNVGTRHGKQPATITPVFLELMARGMVKQSPHNASILYPTNTGLAVLRLFQEFGGDLDA